ncbi:DNA-3-methyladenine glycosylase I [candidate division WWE3 bacterium]|nr:DNA-3-methyladenine glycosylase I [candidate division WWE3 bacterium]
MQEKHRCTWSLGDESMIKYHDEEWGVPLFDDAKLFEFMVLDTFQAGLSWKTILHKRENFRQAFDNFDFSKIKDYDENKYLELLNNPGIIRNRAKIKGTIINAKLFLEVQKDYGSFAKFIWKFVDGHPIVSNIKIAQDIRATSPESDSMSKELKSLGFKFVGSTICYAFMQAAGMINDHEVRCFRFKDL